MSHYPNLNRDSSCKCKYCLTQDQIKQKRISHQRRGHNYEHQVHGHLSGGGGGGSPVAGRVATCGRVRGTSPPRYPKVEQQNCCKGIKCSLVEDPVECHKTRFQELRKTWSEFARVCNCPNCKGSLQKEQYLDKLVESADRAASYNNCEEDCCCSASSIPSNPHNHKSQRPINRQSDFSYDQQQPQKLQQQHEEYYMQHQQNQHQMPPYTYHEVSSDEGLADCPGNVDCKCMTCSCRSSKDTCNGGRLRAPIDVGVGMVPRCGGMKKERFKHPYY